MKKLPFILLLTFVLLIILTGCGNDLTYSEVSIDHVESNLDAFIQQAEPENGIYLFFHNDDSFYVYVTSGHLTQGERPLHISNFNIEREADVLNIYYEEEQAEEESNNHRLYLVKLDKPIEEINAYKNGEEIPFAMVGGS
ncbi:hypothetical protein M3689_08080 [Alkalihalophilus marmarensis]|jgi:hypothetical protein|uniref:Uncharacterized protein n=1 Tax=Alkalihalophilus marmarensis DSM 21297 TaxID=1188261 RepID=U6SWR7_9BACI|nr:hypothetical protein [Alkalihalophilus marmarensis]ERN55106.1 hypothetical protein A33I_03965 [Alkalihalophilus marmarensis DSM 21297]MCM3489254.1 hypothetical protein [Alkalihalophilus marmarensis]